MIWLKEFFSVLLIHHLLQNPPRMVYWWVQKSCIDRFSIFYPFNYFRLSQVATGLVSFSIFNDFFKSFLDLSFSKKHFVVFVKQFYDFFASF